MPETRQCGYRAMRHKKSLTTRDRECVSVQAAVRRCSPTPPFRAPAPSPRTRRHATVHAAARAVHAPVHLRSSVHTIVSTHQARHAAACLAQAPVATLRATQCARRRSAARGLRETAKSAPACALITPAARPPARTALTRRYPPGVHAADGSHPLAQRAPPRVGGDAVPDGAARAAGSRGRPQSVARLQSEKEHVVLPCAAPPAAPPATRRRDINAQPRPALPATRTPAAGDLPC